MVPWPTPVWSLIRPVRGVQYVLCKEAHKLGLYASVIRFVDQDQTIHSLHCPTSPLDIILSLQDRKASPQNGEQRSDSTLQNKAMAPESNP